MIFTIFNYYSRKTEGQNRKILDAKYWCEPQLLKSAISKIPEPFALDTFDGFAGLETKAFYLTGMVSALFDKPTLILRKYKPSYENREHQRVDFTNWRGQPESIVTIFRHNPKLKEVVLIDDLIDTGTSLTAST